MTANGGSARPEQPCHHGCTHTEAQHQSFDDGVLAGEYGSDETPPLSVADPEAWRSGYSAGRLNRPAWRAAVREGQR